MFDNTIFSITAGMAWLCIILYTVMVFQLLRNYKTWPFVKYGTRRKEIGLFLYFLFFAVTYTIDSDFFHYKDVVLTTTEIMPYGFEEFYQNLIIWINNDYLLFRIIVWGGALIAYFASTKIFKCNTSIALILLLVMFGGIFSYARASLAFCVYYFGLLLLINALSLNKNRKFLLFVCALGLIISSFWLHRSMALLIAMTPVVFFKINKKSIIALLILTPLVIYTLQSIFGDILSLAEFDDVISRRINDSYYDRESVDYNWKGRIGQCLHYGLYAVSIYVISTAVPKLKTIEGTGIVERMFTYLIVLSYISVTMLVLFDGNDIYTHRYLKTTIIPITLSISYLYEKQLISIKQLNIILLIAILGRYWGFSKFMFL